MIREAIRALVSGSSVTVEEATSIMEEIMASELSITTEQNLYLTSLKGPYLSVCQIHLCYN